MSDDMRIQGSVEIKIVDRDSGEVLDERHVDNLEVNSGNRHMALRMTNTSSTYNAYKVTNMFIGNNATAPALTDTVASVYSGYTYYYQAGTTNYWYTTSMVARAVFGGNTYIDPAGYLGNLNWRSAGLTVGGTSVLLARITFSDIGSAWATSSDAYLRWTISYV